MSSFICSSDSYICKPISPHPIQFLFLLHVKRGNLPNEVSLDLPSTSNKRGANLVIICESQSHWVTEWLLTNSTKEWLDDWQVWRATKATAKCQSVVLPFNEEISQANQLFTQEHWILIFVKYIVIWFYETHLFCILTRKSCDLAFYWGCDYWHWW